MTWLYLGFAILAEVIGTTALKATDGFTKLVPAVIVVLGYGISFVFLSLALRTIPVAVAYAVWSGVGIVLISILGWVIYKQVLDAPAVIGIGLIMAGVVILNLFSTATA